jgi:hypothetical protein
VSELLDNCVGVFCGMLVVARSVRAVKDQCFMVHTRGSDVGSQLGESESAGGAEEAGQWHAGMLSEVLEKRVRTDGRSLWTPC